MHSTLQTVFYYSLKSPENSSSRNVKRVPLKKGGRTHTHYMFMRKLNRFALHNQRGKIFLLTSLSHPVLLILGSTVSAAVIIGLAVFAKPVRKAGGYLAVIPFVLHS